MKQYVFGYGSMINYKNINQIDIINKRGIPVLVTDLERQFILTDKNSQYFGVYDSPNKFTNGVLLEINQEELKRLDKREKYYKKELLNKNRIKFIYENFKLSQDDLVYIFYPIDTLVKKTKYIKNDQIKEYIKLILIGSVKFGKKFLIDFLESSKDIKTAAIDILE